jgi:hypothetical protein
MRDTSPTLAVVVVVLLAIAGFLFYRLQQTAAPTPQAPQPPAEAPAPPPVPPPAPPGGA